VLRSSSQLRKYYHTSCLSLSDDLQNDLVPTLLEIGVTEELLLRCGLAMHIPLRPMLGGITRDLGEMLTKLSGREFTCEYKYDGRI
jgi:DNA ligase-1